MTGAGAKPLPEKRYFRIGEVCDITGLKSHVLRYWETEFKQLKPVKTKSHQRLYRKKDVETVIQIKRLLYDQKFTIAGARTRLEEKKKSGPETAPRQLHIDFDPAAREEMLNTIIAELSELKALLDKTPEKK